MATLEELRERSNTLFTELLRPRPREHAFSWFDPEDGVAAAVLSLQLSALAASGATAEDGLAAALDHAENERQTASQEAVEIALALFVTHNRAGRRLAKPRTVAAAPELFSPPRAGGRQPAISIGGLSPGLDYWREDVLANEHHKHWHEVYPWPGIPPSSFSDWLDAHSTDELVEILTALDPSQAWADIVPTLSPEELAGLFGDVLRFARDLPRELYTKLFRLNDRQGELFFYMHSQMLARYDAELLSHGLARVAPFGPDQWEDPIAAGHDPIEVEGFGRREENEAIAADDVTSLRQMWDEIETALEDGRLRALGGGTVPIDRTNLGEAVEATAPQLRDLAEDRYPGLHGSGHVDIAALGSPDAGVMISPVTAIRDPVFWQWHKAIDDLNVRWQDTLEPYTFEDAPPVLVRDTDVILARTSALAGVADPGALGTQLFGGANWDTDFAAGQASDGDASLETIDQLTTTMASANFGGSRIRFLTHEPFSYFLRLENTTDDPVGVTVRIFLAPEAEAADRRMWMELDKFLVDLEPGRQVIHRPDTESSIIKRPAEKSPAAVIPSDGDPDERSYCDCGWPYTLLLPRGTPDGMPFRLLVLCTDASIDGVEHPEHCGSMSYCGAVDRYPDARDMGYPFSRPFAGPAATAIEDTLGGLDTAAARTVTIRHA
ncbi:MAG TPA: tyrosinase family protein [Solirubrobacteraceae bacterium]